MRAMKINKISNYTEIYNDIDSWSVWECPISEFDWEYRENEVCLIIDGEVIVTTDDETVIINKGDFVKFPEGLKCKWNVLKPIRKYYKFI